VNEIELREKMADMDETGQPTAFEEDPAAAFLAREQDELGGLVEDTLGFTPGASEVSLLPKRGCAPLTLLVNFFRPASLSLQPSPLEKAHKMKETFSATR
jgi:hypothetical protein